MSARRSGKQPATGMLIGIRSSGADDGDELRVVLVSLVSLLLLELGGWTTKYELESSDSHGAQYRGAQTG